MHFRSTPSLSTCWVVGTSVEKDHRALGDVRNVSHGPGKVKATGLGVVVGVALHVEASVLENGSMVAPAGLWQVNCPG